MTTKKIILIANDDNVEIDLCGTITDFTTLLVTACDDVPHLKKAMELSIDYINKNNLQENENR